MKRSSLRRPSRRPEVLGRPFTRWSIRKLVVFLGDNESRIVVIGRERLREILKANQITFQRTRTWKESNDADRDAKLDRIDEVLNTAASRCFAFDEFGPLAIRPTGGSSWTPSNRPQRLPANYTKSHGVRQFHGCYSIGDDQLFGTVRHRKGADNTLRALKTIRDRRPDGDMIHIILDNLSAHKAKTIRTWAKNNNVELCYTPTYSSWANPIEAHFRTATRVRPQQLQSPQPCRVDPPTPPLPPLAQHRRQPPRTPASSTPRNEPESARRKATNGADPKPKPHKTTPARTFPVTALVAMAPPWG